MFAFSQPRKSRKPALTPLIDVVFLLLVFFMLAAQFGREGAIDLVGAGNGSGEYNGPPRLVTVLPDQVMLNGLVQPDHALAKALAPLMDSPDDIIVIRTQDGADVQRFVDIAEMLADAGLRRVVLVE